MLLDQRRQTSKIQHKKRQHQLCWRIIVQPPPPPAHAGYHSTVSHTFLLLSERQHEKGKIGRLNTTNWRGKKQSIMKYFRPHCTVVPLSSGIVSTTVVAVTKRQRLAMKQLRTTFVFLWIERRAQTQAQGKECRYKCVQRTS